jgi:hypothetical protein
VVIVNGTFRYRVCDSLNQWKRDTSELIENSQKEWLEEAERFKARALSGRTMLRVLRWNRRCAQ